MPTTTAAAIIEKLYDLEARLDGVQARPPSRAELRTMADHQEKFDPIFRKLGLVGAPRWSGSESADSYRRRLITGLQPYADSEMQGVRVARLPANSLPHFEQQIVEGATKRADDRSWSPKPGQLREIKIPRPDGTSTITEFAGDPRVTWAPFMPPRVKYVTSWGHDPATGRPLQSSPRR